LICPQAQKFQIAQQTAGVRRAEIFMALMENYKEALDATTNSSESMGKRIEAISEIKLLEEDYKVYAA